MEPCEEIKCNLTRALAGKNVKPIQGMMLQIGQQEVVHCLDGFTTSYESENKSFTVTCTQRGTIRSTAFDNGCVPTYCPSQWDSLTERNMTMGNISSHKINQTAWVHCEDPFEVTSKTGSPFHVQASCIIDPQTQAPTWTSNIELDNIVCQESDQVCILTEEDLTFPNAKPELDYPVGYWVQIQEVFSIQCNPRFYMATDRSKTDFATTCQRDEDSDTDKMGLEDSDADVNQTQCVNNVTCSTESISQAILVNLMSNFNFSDRPQYNETIRLSCPGEHEKLKVPDGWVKTLDLTCQWNGLFQPSLSIADLKCEDRSCLTVIAPPSTTMMVGPFVNETLVEQSMIDSGAFQLPEDEVVTYRCLDGYRLANRHTFMSIRVSCEPPEIKLPDWTRCVLATTCRNRTLGNAKARLQSRIETKRLGLVLEEDDTYLADEEETYPILKMNNTDGIEDVIFYFNRTVQRSLFPEEVQRSLFPEDGLKFCEEQCPMIDQNLERNTYMFVFNCSQRTICSRTEKLLGNDFANAKVNATFRRDVPSGYRDCAELYQEGFDGLNGIVYNSRRNWDRCEMGWTYIYIRNLIENQNLSSEDFHHQIAMGDSFYWMGLRDITNLTTAKQYELKVDFFKSNGENARITYGLFRIIKLDASFVLHIGEPDFHNSDIPDSFSVHNGTTFQFAYNNQKCGTDKALIGWFQSCLLTVNLFGDQFFWMGLKQSDQLKKIEMAIRPSDFNSENISQEPSNPIWVADQSEIVYGDRINLFCPPGYGLLYPERESYTCDWAEINDDSPFNECIAKSCPFLPHEKIILTNMVPALTRNTNEVLINETISYHCKSGTFFEDNMTRREMNFTCQPTMTYEYDHSLSTSCVWDKKCTNWPEKPTNGQMSVSTGPRKYVGLCRGYLTPVVFPFCSVVKVTWNYVYPTDQMGQVSLNVSVTPRYRQKIAFVFSHKRGPLNETITVVDHGLSTETYLMNGFNLEDPSTDYLPCILNVFCGQNFSHYEPMEENAQTELGFHNVIKYSCLETERFQNSNGVLYPRTKLQCDWNGQWLDLEGQLVEKLDPCIIYACPKPPIHLNGTFLTLSNLNHNENVVLINDSVTYQCQPGRKFGPDATLDIYFNMSCLDNGNYATIWPICEDPLSKFCPPLEENVANGSYSMNVTSVTVQTDIIFTCDRGFSIQTNASYGQTLNATSQRFYCHWNQTWDTTSVYPCERTHCTIIPNGTDHHLVPMQPLDMVSFGTSMVYECDSANRFFENDKFQQTLELECMPDGLLYPLELTHCLLEEEVACLDTPPMPPPGVNRFWTGDEKSYNSTATYVCQTHKESQNESQIDSICQWNKNWTSIDSFACQPTHCPKLPNPSPDLGLFYSPDKSSAENLAFIYNDGLGQPSPKKGYVLPVPEKFEDERVLIIDGLVFRDEWNQSVQLVLMNYINGGYHEIHSIDLEPWLFGEGSEEHFLLQIEKRNSSALNITNMESLIQGIEYNPPFQGLEVKGKLTGKVTVNFIGLVKPDETYAIPVGDTIAFECPHNQVLTSQPYLAPTINLVCGANGAIDVPNPWPMCVSYERGLNNGRETIPFETFRNVQAPVLEFRVTF